jgi:hypothetical protein
MLYARTRFLTLVLGAAATSMAAQAATATAARGAASNPGPQQTAHFDGGMTLLGGTWQFHLGDDPEWAAPGFDDSGWEKLTVDKPWGEQGHFAKDGFAWYRKHVLLPPGGAAPQQLALLVPAVEDAYELYWNGRLVGTYGVLPPHPLWYFDMRPHTWGLGPARSGVLAARVWKSPFASSDDGRQGGFYAPAMLGSPVAITAAMGMVDYRWLRSRQVTFGLESLYGLVALLGFLVWLRDKSQWLAFWMAMFAVSRPLALILLSLKLPISMVVGIGLNQPVYVLGDVSLWYVLLWLLDLHGEARLVQLTKILAIVEFSEAIVDGLLSFGFAAAHPYPWQMLDLALMPLVTALELYPFYLIGLAVIRKRNLDVSRWIVAVLAFLGRTIFVTLISFSQGSRFTHWTFYKKIGDPLFTVLGNPVNARTLTDSLLLIALAYAVYRYSAENQRHQARLEEEIRNAREVQQVLIPDAIPEVPGFKVASVYKPAEEVGGDFFQILPLPGGGLLAVIGDVSGKGMPAAMTVSLLVGTVRTLAHYTQKPAEIMAAMNQRMLARSQGGFTTCLILRVDPNGRTTIANAGHLAPYRRNKEIAIEYGLPLGLEAEARYDETTFQLEANEQLTLITDGVVEARNRSGELFGFERTAEIATDTAESIAEAAQKFGQHDDITVLTLSREKVREAPAVERSAVLTESMA